MLSCSKPTPVLPQGTCQSLGHYLTKVTSHHLEADTIFLSLLVRSRPWTLSDFRFRVDSGLMSG